MQTTFKTLPWVITRSVPIILWVVCFFCCTTERTSAQTIRYVAPTASGIGNGSSWANTSADLQSMINAAVAGDEIRVAAGMYLPTQDPSGNASPAEPRTKTFYLKNEVKIYGGYNVTTGLRDILANVTTLSGDIGTTTNVTDNVYHVVLSVSDASTTILDGFTVTGGNTNNADILNIEGQTINSDGGGGIYNANSSLSVTNCIFSNNASVNYGGGMYNDNSSPIVTNCAFNNNIANVHGGGMFNYGGVPTVINCTFSNNTAGIYGGGMINYTSTPTVINAVFSNNTATESGGGMYNYDLSTEVINCTFSNNTATNGGGGMYNNTSTTTVTNCTFSNNAASTNGGGMYNAESSILIVKNSIFWATTTTNLIFNDGGTFNITYSIVKGGFAGAGNMSTDPLFVAPTNPAGADGIFRTADDGFRLQANSPAINTGTNIGAPTTDILGTARPQGGSVDMGAYERVGCNVMIDIVGDTTACGSVSLTASGGEYYEWTGGSASSAATNDFTTSGIYTVSATDATMTCTTTASVNVTITTPVLSLTTTGTTCPKTVTASGGDTYEWSNGETTAAITAPYGTYTVTATSAEGCTATASLLLECCTFDITDVKYTVYSYNKKVVFNTPNTQWCAIGSNITYAWDFGDGTSSTTSNPSKTYATAGIYTVSITATCTNPVTGQSCVSTCSRTVNVPDACSALKATFGYKAQATADVAFSFSGNTNGAGTTQSWNVLNSAGTSVGTGGNTNMFTFTFPAGGEYTVCRTVAMVANATNGNYCNTQHCRSITVAAAGGCIAVPQFAVLLKHTTPMAATFSSNATGATTQEWAYSTSATGTFTNFGTGATTETFTFASAGTYWVRLTLNKGSICENTVTHRVEISPVTTTALAGTGLAVTDFRYTLYSYKRDFIANTPVVTGCFSGTNALTYLWDFGGNTSGGTTSTVGNPNVVYSTAGTYTVNLTVTCTPTGGGTARSVQVSRTINIGAIPAATLKPTFSFTAQATTTNYSFAGTTNTAGVTQAWELFNSSGTSIATAGNIATYTYAFPATGEYKMCRTVTRTANATNGNVTSAKHCRTFTVVSGSCATIARFSANVRSSTPLTVACSSTSAAATTQEWAYSTTANGTFTNFGTTTAQSFAFPTYGTYWVRLIINKGTPCETSVTHRIELQPQTCTPSTDGDSGNKGAVVNTDTDKVTDLINGDALGISVYPNPTNGVVTVAFGNDITTNTTISVYDMRGALMTTQRTQTGTTQATIDLADFPSGIYLFHVQPDSGAHITKKVMKD